MRFPNLRQWAPFRTSASASESDSMDLDEMGTAFGLDESLRGDAEEPAPTEPTAAEGSEEPFAWLARRGMRPQR